MARLARVVIPGLPHHVTQRGNRREPVFFEEEDYRAYLALISAAARKSGTEIWAFCLTPNHVHFITTPTEVDSLRQTFAEAHRRYTGRINARFFQTATCSRGRSAALRSTPCAWRSPRAGRSGRRLGSPNWRPIGAAFWRVRSADPSPDKKRPTTRSAYFPPCHRNSVTVTPSP